MRSPRNLIDDAIAARRLARANAQLNILENGTDIPRNPPVCFVAGTPVMTGERLELIEEDTLTEGSPANSALDELFLPTVAIAVGAAGYWDGKRRSAKRRREEEQFTEAAYARAFADWDKWDGIL